MGEGLEPYSLEAKEVLAGEMKLFFETNSFFIKVNSPLT